MSKTDARMVRSSGSLSIANDGSKPQFGRVKVPTTHLFVDETIKCGYSFSELERAEHFETKIERFWRNLLFCLKTASPSAAPFVLRFLHYSGSRFNKCEFFSPKKM